MILKKFGYLLREGITSIFTHGFMSFASVTIIAACLIIMGSFALLGLNIDAVIKDLEDENQVIAFIDETYTEDEARAMIPVLMAVPNVREVVYMDRAEAYQNYVEKIGEQELFEDIDASIFRDRFLIYLDDIALLADTQRQVRLVQGVADINASQEVAEGFIMVRNIVSAVSLVLIFILGVISIFIMSNTIKLATFVRREEIAIMKIVGATNAFIRFPFFVEGLILGAVGGGVAFLTQWGIYEFVSGEMMAGLAGRFIEVIPFEVIMIPVLLVFLGVGFVVGAFGSSIAIRNYLKV